MDLLDRLLGHDAWTTGELLRRAGELTDDQLARTFGIGPGGVRDTLGHIVRNVEVWTDLMARQPVRAPGGASVAELIDRHERAAADLAAVARPIAARAGWDERWLDTLDDPPREKTYGGAIAHVVTHSMHHRAQVLYMMRALGLANLPEGDALTWENRHHRTD